MSSATLPTKARSPLDGSPRSRQAPSIHTARISGTPAQPALPDELFQRLVVRLPGPGDREPLADLARRVGAAVPGTIALVADVDGRLLAAGGRDASSLVSDPTPAGLAAEALIRHRLAELRRRRVRLRRPGSPS